MTKLSGFWSEIIHICFIYIYNDRKQLFVFVFPSYMGGGVINFLFFDFSVGFFVYVYF
jgi:prepilin-type processing-associated H-X9-DG protein